MAKTVQQMLDAANAVVPKVDTTEARRLVEQENALLVDLRDSAEIEKTGRLKGAAAVSRGMLEFRADRESKYHDPAFDPARPMVLYCGSGGRAALAGQTLTEMGYHSVYNLGGFQQAADAGMETEQ
ncbi:rhodanese-like domain-containing protein [Paracoccus sp. MC1862]|uniref:rhodanese-like domain-containing protein n=1 Tax=Paracoccus sp. MC1862 TaxID=2760307 RepID=UPI0015FF8F59|nr:rhodanese-like domain-containing protein [Paracoccus sp. MC1862]MBB1499303.1 rhodanese-like domain-containing protein [Paracoccus sp. MC1862]QQO46037.1 rhodanese-like domain-containing protein [Paracoccus sp. MC1862]